MKKVFNIVLPAFFSLTLALAACTPASGPASAPAAVEEPVAEPVAEEPVALGTIVDIAAGNPDFSTLVAAVQAAGEGGWRPAILWCFVWARRPWGYASFSRGRRTANRPRWHW